MISGPHTWFSVRLPRPLRLVLLSLALFVMFGSATAKAAPSYRFHGVPWPGGEVRYYNAAPSQAWALWQAVAAWNRSGARVRFVATSRKDAQLIIRHDRSVADCKRARATVGFVPGATVKIFARRDASTSCNRYTAARFLVHELGHVLGLRHEDGGCATMNSAGWYGGGGMCPSGKPWEWRCQLLEPDDIHGVIAIYGGSLKRQKRSSPLCPLYDPITPPSRVMVSSQPNSQEIELSFRPAADPALPAFLAARVAGLGGFAYLAQPNTCPSPSAFYAAIRGVWSASNRNGFSAVVDRFPPGTYCYAVWSIDAFNRPSSRVSTALVTVPAAIPIPSPAPPPPPAAP